MKKSVIKSVIGALAAGLMLAAIGCSADSSGGSSYDPSNPVVDPSIDPTVDPKDPADPTVDPSEDPVSGAITFFASSAEAYSANGTVASELEGVTAKVASYSWGTLTTKTGTATPAGEPTVGKLTGSDFKDIPDAVQNSKDASKYDISGIVFMPSAVAVGGDTGDRTTALAAGSEYFTLVLDVTAGETDLTLKSISGLVAQANGSGFGTFINGTDTGVKGKAMTLNTVSLGDVKVAAGEKTQVTIAVKATSDWNAYGDKTASVLFKNIVINAEAEAPAEVPPAVTEYECPGCHAKYSTEADKNNCSTKSGCPKYVAPTEPEKTGDVSIDITIDDKTVCAGCGTEYETKKLADACGNQKGCPAWVAAATCPECGEGCDTEEDAAAHALADKTCAVCGEVKESKATAEACAVADLLCEDCGKTYATKAEADACTHYTCANCGEVHMNAAALAACATKEGCAAWKTKCAECEKEYSKTADAEACATADKTCANCETVHNSKADADACATKEGCPAWYAECSNCKEHYSTQSAADNCGKQEGCPKYGAVTTVKVVAGSVVSDNAAVGVTYAGNTTKADLTYNGITYSVLMKMESSTTIKLTGVAGKTVTLVTSGTATDKGINLNSNSSKTGGVRVKGNADGTVVISSEIVDANIKDGVLTICKDDTRNIAVIFIE